MNLLVAVPAAFFWVAVGFVLAVGVLLWLEERRRPPIYPGPLNSPIDAP